VKLYLVQHGEAKPKEVNELRPLTEKGKNDVSKMAIFLKSAGVKVDTIWHSEKQRSIETAEIIGREVSPRTGLKKKEGLAPNDPVDKWQDTLERTEEDTMIVGHLPFLQKLSGLLLANSESSEIVAFCQGGCVCLERKAPKSWELIWAVCPQLIK